MLRTLNLVFVVGLVILFFGCGSKKSAIYISVDGKEFSKSELLVDDNRIGRFEQHLVTKTGEFYVDGKFTKRDTASILLKDKDNYSGAMMYFSIPAGKHRVLLISDSGRKIGFEKTIKPGENYVMLKIENSKVYWNKEEYSIK